MPVFWSPLMVTLSGSAFSSGSLARPTTHSMKFLADGDICTLPLSRIATRSFFSVADMPLVMMSSWSFFVRPGLDNCVNIAEESSLVVSATAASRFITFESSMVDLLVTIWL